MLPLGIYRTDSKNGNGIFDFHWHTEMEFLVVVQGSVLFQVESESCEAHAGQVVFVNSGELHAASPMYSTDCTVYALVFDPVFLFSHNYDELQRKYLDPFINREYSIPARLSGSEEWERTVFGDFNEIIRACTRKDFAYELLVKSRLYSILHELLCNSPAAGQKKPYETQRTGRIKKVLHHIEENYGRRLEIAELAELVNTSEGHLCRLFKKIVSKTLVEYINIFRINKASELLLDTDKKILEIAMDVGFEHFSYFIKVFKRLKGCPPAQYRRKKSA